LTVSGTVTATQSTDAAYTFGTTPSSYDSSSWAVSMFRMGRNHPTTSGNDFGLNVQTYLPATSSAAYERAGILSQIINGDTSSGTTTHDGVAIDGHATIAAGNTTARIWGLNTLVSVPSGTDGVAFGAELGLVNNATNDQPNVGTTTSKHGLHIDIEPGSTQNASVALFIDTGSSMTWHHGIYIGNNAISTGGSAITIPNS